MKLRIQANSIRLRLKQAEVKTLVEGGEVLEECRTAPDSLIYALRPTAEAAMSATFASGRLTVHLPAEWLANWDTDDRVGFTGTDGGLELLVEKDWKCMNPAAPSDNEDCFENPVGCHE